MRGLHLKRNHVSGTQGPLPSGVTSHVGHFALLPRVCQSRNARGRIALGPEHVIPLPALWVLVLKRLAAPRACVCVCVCVLELNVCVRVLGVRV